MHLEPYILKYVKHPLGIEEAASVDIDKIRD